MVPVPVPVLYVSRPETANFSKQILEKNLAFLQSKLFYKEKIYKFHQIYGIM
jgi:hypothetical protein